MKFGFSKRINKCRQQQNVIEAQNFGRKESTLMRTCIYFSVSGHPQFIIQTDSKVGSMPYSPGRVTPFSNSFPFSPVSSQTVSRTSSPAPNLIKREEHPTQGNDTNLSPIGGLLGEGQNSSTNVTQKHRNLLTHGIEEADSSVPKTSSSEKMGDMTGIAENGFGNHNTSGESVSSHNENIILRELLNQEDDDMNDENSKNKYFRHTFFVLKFLTVQIASAAVWGMPTTSHSTTLTLQNFILRHRRF
ncbi:hypothetical protein AVEN_222715-1 [Araneus ventricosus]|uniref:Uncharacterized protein n=1 Tax=Araneus ventricosus TaxID=182803 RepID=A0A4Y2AZE2_ARAVE|nr:hypothetical protein AVEN_222715-1 [Araneus ventricosus]